MTSHRMISHTVVPLSATLSHTLQCTYYYHFFILFLRLFLESNPIPTKMALQLMGKIGQSRKLQLLEYLQTQ